MGWGQLGGKGMDVPTSMNTEQYNEERMIAEYFRDDGKSTARDDEKYCVTLPLVHFPFVGI